jgi:hypothetical protein
MSSDSTTHREVDGVALTRRVVELVEVALPPVVVHGDAREALGDLVDEVLAVGVAITKLLGDSRIITTSPDKVAQDRGLTHAPQPSAHAELNEVSERA